MATRKRREAVREPITVRAVAEAVLALAVFVAVPCTAILPALFVIPPLTVLSTVPIVISAVEFGSAAIGSLVLATWVFTREMAILRAMLSLVLAVSFAAIAMNAGSVSAATSPASLALCAIVSLIALMVQVAAWQRDWKIPTFTKATI